MTFLVGLSSVPYVHPGGYGMGKEIRELHERMPMKKEHSRGERSAREEE
jgi:hypothetical protein